MPDQIINLKKLKTNKKEKLDSWKKKIIYDKNYKENTKPKSFWINFLAGLIQGIGIAMGIVIALGVIILIIELLSTVPEVNEWIGRVINM